MSCFAGGNGLSEKASDQLVYLVEGARGLSRSVLLFLSVKFFFLFIMAQTLYFNNGVSNIFIYLGRPFGGGDKKIYKRNIKRDSIRKQFNFLYL